MTLAASNLHIKPDTGSTPEHLAVSTAVVALDQTLWSTNTRYVLVQFNTAPVRVTFDGTTPADPPYFTFAAGTIAEWSRATAAAAKFLRDSIDASVTVQAFYD